MPRSRLVNFGIASIAVSSLLLAGCASNGGSGGDGKLTYEDSPLYKYSLAMYGGEKNQEDYIKESNAVEELVATCMAKEGFEYVPVDQSQYYTSTPGGGDEVDRNTEEWVAANGYGYNPTDDQMADQPGQDQQFVDPNQDYVMSLSDSEQTAYYEVLQGPQPTEEEMNDPDFQFQQLGCYGEANKSVHGQEIYEKPEFKGLIEKMNNLWEKQQSSPEVKKFNAEWSSCMADAGHPDLASKDAVYDVMNKKSEEAWGDGSTEPTADARKKMRDFEIDLALADFHCSKKLDYDQKVLAAQFKIEEQFIADNKAELDAMLAAANQGK